MLDKIQVGIACGHNTHYYVDFLLKSIKKTINKNRSIEILLGINKPSFDSQYVVARHQNNFKIKTYNCITDEVGSHSPGHGKCLNYLFDKMDAKFGMFIDADVAFLEKDWDIKLISKLKDNFVAIGADT